MAVLAGLRSAPVYRLAHTWTAIAPHAADRFARIEDFMSEAENHRCVHGCACRWVMMGVSMVRGRRGNSKT